jgi:hypothetical protein
MVNTHNIFNVATGKPIIIIDIARLMIGLFSESNDLKIFWKIKKKSNLNHLAQVI